MNRMGRHVSSVLFLMCFGVGALQATPNETVQFSGIITNAKDKPIEGVAVSLDAKDIHLSAKTNTKGQFDFNKILPGEYRFSASKYHMLTFTERMMLDKPKQSFNVSMLSIALAVYHYLPQTDASWFG